MAYSQLYYPPTTNALQKSLGAALDQGVTASVTLNNVTGIQDKPGVILINRIDTNDAELAASVREFVVYTGVSGSTLTGLTRAIGGTSDQDHAVGSVVEFIFDLTAMQALIDFLLVDHLEADGSHKMTSPQVVTGINDTNDNELIKVTATGSAVNEFTVANAASGGNPALSATGETNVGIELTPAGTGEVEITANDLNLSGTTPNIQIGGADPWRTVFIGANAMAPTTTSGCAAVTTVEAGTNDIDYDVLDFDTSSDENAYVNFQMPDSWDAGVIQFRYVWTTASGGAAETVTFELSGISYANDDAIDTAAGTAVEVADTWIADGDVHISSWSGDVTLAGTPAAGELVHLEIMRDVSEDDLGGDARLIGIQIRYKQAQYTD